MTYSGFLQALWYPQPIKLTATIKVALNTQSPHPPTHKVDLLYFVTQLRYKYNCEILLINLTIVSAATVIVHRLLTLLRNYL